MRKPILTLGVADKLAELLAAAPAKPETDRAVPLDAVIERMWPILAKKMREDGWTRAECAAFLKANAIDRSIADIMRSIGRHETPGGKKKPSPAPPKARGGRAGRRGNASASGVRQGDEDEVSGKTRAANSGGSGGSIDHGEQIRRRNGAAVLSGRSSSGDDV